MRRSQTVLIASLMVGCSAGAPPPTNDPDSVTKLKKLTAQHDELKKRFDATPPEIREQCDFTEGDCLLLVREKRHELTRSRHFPECHGETDLDQRERCEEERLVESGKAEEMTEYFSFKNWCIGKLLECAAALEDKGAAKASEIRFDKRKRSLETSPQARALQGEVELAKANADYLRSTLPPSAEDVCKEMREDPECRQRVEKLTRELEAEFAKEEGEYAAKAAARLLEKIRKTEAGCYQPEFDCLSEKLDEHGATPKTRKSLQRNLDLLEQRQRLLSEVSRSTADRCLEEGLSAHQSRTDKALRRYAKRPTTYFRLRLHRAFRSLHRSQIKCLERSTK